MAYPAPCPQSLIKSQLLFQRIPKESGTLSQLVDFAMVNRRLADASKPVGEAIDDYVQAREKECLEDHIAKVQFIRIRSEIPWWLFGVAGLTIMSLRLDRIYLRMRLGSEQFLGP